jgi:hypothetical protein
MKSTFSFLPLALVSMFLMSGMCKKSGSGDPDGPDGPDVTFPTTGHLVTMGRNADNHIDTITFYLTTLAWDLTVYNHPFLRADDEVTLRPNGNGTMTIIRRTPHMHQNIPYKWFGIEENISPDFSQFPNNKYLFEFFHPSESILTQFVIKRSEDDMYKFTIESKAYPGYYLGCAKWKNAVYPTTNRLVFTTSPAIWWLVQK